jgi:hypothetical protein
MTMNLFKTLPALGLIFVLQACYKPGCTDPGALNYDEKAKQDDLSCSYTGSVVFWMKPTTSDSLIDLDHEVLRFELEGAMVDSVTTSAFRSATGGCNNSGTKTIARNITGNTERSYKYRVRGLDYETIYEGFVTLKADDCIGVQLK